jgi:hypothetical protein
MIGVLQPPRDQPTLPWVVWMISRLMEFFRQHGRRGPGQARIGSRYMPKITGQAVLDVLKKKGCAQEFAR